MKKRKYHADLELDDQYTEKLEAGDSLTDSTKQIL